MFSSYSELCPSAEAWGRVGELLAEHAVLPSRQLGGLRCLKFNPVPGPLPLPFTAAA